MKRKNHVLVIGGGAAGMTAAISARRLGAAVTILEKNPRVGKKILATGNGRCNFTNINTGVEHYNGSNPKFVHSALASFSAEDTIRFFEKLGIQHKVEDGGKVFPMSDQASSVLDVLLYELNSLGVDIVCDACVKDITGEKGSFAVKLENGKVYRGDRVIIAAGGKAMPSSGSDGSGFELAKKLGHAIVPVFPALVQLMLEGPFFKAVSGVKFVGTAGIVHNNKLAAMDRGDILFANYGVSGPPILQISRKAGELLNEGEEVFLKITVLDTFTADELKLLIKKRFRNGSRKLARFEEVAVEIGLLGWEGDFTVDEVVTLASVVEREAGTADELPYVSAVFHNRLKLGMNLGSCATVQYVLKERKPRLSTKDTQIQSPYNTYIVPGLPIGPIASPGREALKAAMEPADSDYLYFVATNEGTNVFSSNYQQFLKDKEKYR